MTTNAVPNRLAELQERLAEAVVQDKLLASLEKAAWDHANMLAQARANHAHFVQHLRDEVWDAS